MTGTVLIGALCECKHVGHEPNVRTRRTKVLKQKVKKKMCD